MENASPHAPHKKVRLSKTPVAAIIIIVLLLFAGGYYFYTTRLAGVKRHASKQKQFDMSMMKQSPAPLTSKQKQQLADGTSSSTKVKPFFVTGGNFYFTPNTITVNQGDTVKIVFNDISGTHDFVIDELHVRTPIIREGQFAVTSFIAEKKGTYEYYCSLSGHRQQGMKGTLIVQ